MSRTVRKLAMVSVAAAASLAVTPAASADTSAKSAPVNASVSTDQATVQAGAQAWSKWFRLNKVRPMRNVKCRTYASVNSGSKIKYRGYVECTKKTTITVYVSGSAIGMKTKTCYRKTWCDVVRYKNNRKGKQKWCATAPMPMIASEFWPTTDRYRAPKACIRY
ncbi:hypothetical protein SMC26_29310 [Actinomadura fulvescens]|uniref:Secreted protein n=1 Tax=Actinomadura fulvescens TaxID=46160 RepID=A0ABN3QJW1_9ACTN